MHQSENKTNNQLTISPIIGWGIAALFGMGALLPELFWGVHWLHFLPLSQWLPLVLIALLLLGLASAPFGNSLSSALTAFDRIPKNRMLNMGLATAIGICYGLLCYSFPIEQDYYGNARSFIPKLDRVVEVLPEGWQEQLFSFRVEPGNGRRGLRLFYELISFTLGVELRQVFLSVNALCGGVFAFVWLYCCSKLPSLSAALVFSLAGLTCGFMLNFFGHIDTYGPIYLLLLVWLLLFIQMLEKKQIWLLIFLLPLFLVCLRMHNLMLLLMPALVFSVLRLILNNLQKFNWLFTSKGLGLFVVLPSVLFGLVLYFFVLKDHKDPRVLKDFVDTERLFLPLFSPAAPYEKYNLLSFNHFFDLFQILLFAGPVLLPLIFALIMNSSKEQKAVGITGRLLLLSTVLICLMLFMFNPLMSMPMDWDVLVFPFPILLVFSWYWFRRQGLHSVSPRGSMIACSIACLSLSSFAVLSQLKPHSYRMEAVGVYVYKTYYAHSDSYLLYALQMIPDQPDLYIERKERLLQKLSPYAQIGVDEKYAALLTDDGVYKLRALNKPLAALRDFENSDRYSPNWEFNVKLMVETAIELGDKCLLDEKTTQLISISLSSELQILKSLLALCMHRECYDLAQAYLHRALQISPDDMDLISLQNEMK